MYAAPGVGLAATQVDVHKRIIVIDVSEARNDLQGFHQPDDRRRRGRGRVRGGLPFGARLLRQRQAGGADHRARPGRARRPVRAHAPRGCWRYVFSMKWIIWSARSSSTTCRRSSARGLRPSSRRSSGLRASGLIRRGRCAAGRFCRNPPVRRDGAGGDPRRRPRRRAGTDAAGPAAGTRAQARDGPPSRRWPSNAACRCFNRRRSRACPAAAADATPLDVLIVAAYGLILPQADARVGRATVRSTSMPRCCRAGAAPPRSSARCWPATGDRHQHHADGCGPRHRSGDRPHDRADRAARHRGHADGEARGASARQAIVQTLGQLRASGALGGAAAGRRRGDLCGQDRGRPKRRYAGTTTR